MSEQTLRSAIIRLAHQHPEMRGTLLPLVKKAYAGDLELTGNPSQAEVSNAWPGISYNGVQVFEAYMEITPDIERKLEKLAGRGTGSFSNPDLSRSGQEAYLGYSSTKDLFVSGWDWWYDEGGLLTGYVTMPMRGGRFEHFQAAGFIEEPLYEAGRAELKRMFHIDLDLRLD